MLGESADVLGVKAHEAPPNLMRLVVVPAFGVRATRLFHRSYICCRGSFTVGLRDGNSYDFSVVVHYITDLTSHVSVQINFAVSCATVKVLPLPSRSLPSREQANATP